ncbi:MAG: cysteine desulfurase family protein [Candidatus Nanoarchaeia archaeon]|jgi:cysteine desulfurase
MNKKIYFDNGATTMTDPLVVKAMTPYFTIDYGNPSSLHSFGTKAREAVELSRKVIATKINAKPQEIIFTSGGTESDNLAIKGIAGLKGKGHIITSNIEHPAVLNTCKKLETKGFKVTYLKVDNEGLINPIEVEKAIRPDTILVTIMHANNEIGTIQPIKEIHQICLKNKIPFHTDAVQSFTKTPLSACNADLISLSAHKIHGPKGVGALFVREGLKLERQNDGGSHEQGFRAGTENTPSIVGFAKAVELTNNEGLTELRDYIINELLNIPNSILNGSKNKRLCNNINITFKGVEGESLLLHLDAKGIAVSTGSACSSHSLKPSHVLTAIGLKPEESHGSIRITISRFTTKEEIDYLIKSLKEIVKNLREMSPLK